MDRIKTIVAAMSEYSHPSTEILAPVDLNHLIEITLTMCRSEWKNVAMVRLQLDKALPLVPCMSGEISQVLINLIVNAAHAIADVLPSTEGGMGVIVISTAVYADWVVISITDTGSGIPLAIRDQIFEPQFTAKGIGNGTGQGLALAWSVVVDKHHGTITFDSEIGEGTTFRIRLPLHGTPAAEDLVHPALTANRTIILSGQEETQRHVAKTHAQLR
jgi:signal transduction histidine kinase